MRKLVRHLLPAAITVKAGRFEIPKPQDRGDLLRRKLLEEVSEYLEANDPRELVDIVEVCCALAENAGWAPTVFLREGERKIEQRGHLRAPGLVWVVGE